MPSIKLEPMRVSINEKRRSSCSSDESSALSGLTHNADHQVVGFAQPFRGANDVVSGLCIPLWHHVRREFMQSAVVSPGIARSANSFLKMPFGFRNLINFGT